MGQPKCHAHRPCAGGGLTRQRGEVTDGVHAALERGVVVEVDNGFLTLGEDVDEDADKGQGTRATIGRR